MLFEFLKVLIILVAVLINQSLMKKRVYTPNFEEYSFAQESIQPIFVK